MVFWIIPAIIVLFVLITLVRTVRIIPQARAAVVERLGRYSRTLTPGLALVVPFVDRIRPLIDLREQVVSFPPQPVITEDNLVVSIDSVIYFQVTDPKSVTYEIANYIQAIEQLTVTTLRNVIGGMALEKTLTSRDEINSQLRERPRRGDRQVGHPRQSRRAEGDRPARVDPGLDGEADARRPREARHDPPGRRARSSPRSSRPKARRRQRSCAPRGSDSR